MKVGSPWIAFFLLCCNCASAIAGQSENLLTLEDPLWQTTVRVVENGQAKWDPKAGILFISPTIQMGSAYVPYDWTDAWREMDKMLPMSYVEQLVKETNSRCELAVYEEGRARIRAMLLRYLSYTWLSPSSSKDRFIDFLNIVFASNRKKARLNSEEFEEVVVAVVLCGYIDYKKDGDFPSLGRLSDLFRSISKG